MTLDEQLDKKGKDIFIELLDQFHVSYHLTTYKYDKVDIYFGKSSVGEIKYRLVSYDSYLIEENKIKSLSEVPLPNQYYITVLDNDIYLWRVSTISKFEPQYKILPIDVDKTKFRKKLVRFLPTSAADFHFSKCNNQWKLISFD